MDTSAVDEKLRMYLPLYSEIIFESPVLRSGSKYHFCKIPLHLTPPHPTLPHLTSPHHLISLPLSTLAAQLLQEMNKIDGKCHRHLQPIFHSELWSTCSPIVCCKVWTIKKSIINILPFLKLIFKNLKINFYFKNFTIIFIFLN